MSKIDHEKLNKIARVWQRGPYNRGADANPRDDYLTAREAKAMLERLKRSRNDPSGDFGAVFGKLFERLRAGPQEVVLELLQSRSLGCEIVRSKDQNGNDVLGISVSCPRDDPERLEEKIVLILELAVLFQLRIMDPLAKALLSSKKE